MSHSRSVMLGLLAALSACASAPKAPEVAAGAPSEMRISGASERPEVVGAPANFTGRAVITPLFGTTPYTRATAASVRFDAGARTAWHSHPAGQTIIVTEGTGWVQAEGGERREIHVGDVIWTPPGVRHWHGGTATSAMAHTVVQEQVDGEVVRWGAHVSDVDYLGGPALRTTDGR
ncbi:MAG: cupin domain-containing protein [Myxococcales bacterium]|nr:cupin domain-containing protein [Myxococcales bacterium]